MMKAPTPPKEMVAVVESNVDQSLEVGLGGFGVKGVLVLVSPPQLCQQEFDTILYEQRNCKSSECTEYIQNLVKGRENLVKMTMEYIQKWIGNQGGIWSVYL